MSNKRYDHEYGPLEVNLWKNEKDMRHMIEISTESQEVDAVHEIGSLR